MSRAVPKDVPDVLGVGYNTEDHVCVLDAAPAYGGKTRVRDYFVQPGGQVPTAIVALQRWGLSTAYVGPIADDEGGARQLASLRAEGVVVDGCVRRVGVTGQRSFITIDATSGERTIQWYRDDRLALRTDEVRSMPPAGTRAVLLDGDDVEVAIAVAGRARAAGALVMLDADERNPDTGRLLAVTDIAIVPAGFAQQFAGSSELGAALGAIIECGPSVAAATLGRDGVVALQDGRQYREKALAAEVVDTTSAGDVFHAAFLYSVLRGEQIEQTLRFATAAASLAVARLGGRASIPGIDAVRARMAGG